MSNILELKENGEVLATTSFDIIDIKSSIWLDSLDKEQKQEEGYTKTAFYGEELKLAIEVEGIDDGTELEIEIIAKNDGTLVKLEEDERQPLTLVAKTSSNKVTFEPIYLNPKWFNKDAPITYFFNIKVKGENTYIGENLPSEVENQLKPIGFGKPEIFKTDKTKGYLLVKQSNGTKIAYTSGNRLDIEMYQDWFENESEELDFSNRKQINTYFKSVYLTYLYKWSIRGEFGNETNRKKVIAAFEKAGKKHNIPPSILYTFAVGEGMHLICSNGSNTNLDKPIDSFQAFGLDFFEKQVISLQEKGYLGTSFNSAGTAIDDGDFILPKPFNGDYAIIRYSDGTTRLRNESADKGNVEIYPVVFKNMETGIEGACAVYANAYDYAAISANNVGWGNLTLNQHVFFAYIKIQKTSELGNAEINLYRHKNDANFLDENYTKTRDINNRILNLCYHRWVAWRYILLGNHFSK